MARTRRDTTANPDKTKMHPVMRNILIVIAVPLVVALCALLGWLAGLLWGLVKGAWAVCLIVAITALVAAILFGTLEVDSVSKAREENGTPETR